jgi:hypothetical protein
MIQKKKKIPSRKEVKLLYIQERIKQLREFLLSNNQIASLSVDGMSVSFDRDSALEELKELERQEMNLLNPNNWMRSIDLSRAF